MERAHETLAAADILIESESWHGATNRLYYACFYAVTALLLVHGYESKKHKGVRSLFNKHFLKEGPFPEALGKTYNALFDMRIESDYADLMEAKPERVKEYREKSEELVSLVTQMLSERSSEQ